VIDEGSVAAVCFRALEGGSSEVAGAAHSMGTSRGAQETRAGHTGLQARSTPRHWRSAFPRSTQSLGRALGNRPSP
jgi:hypothetical protein